MSTDTYILLKDLPCTKAGTKFIWNGFEYESEDKSDTWKQEIVETRTDWFAPEVKKSPLGVFPEWLHKEQRLKDLHEAMSRYLSEEKEIPAEWIEEEMILNQWLIVRSWKIKCKKYPNYTEDDLRKAFEAARHTDPTKAIGQIEYNDGDHADLHDTVFVNFSHYLKSITI